MATRNPRPIPPLTPKDIERFWSKVDKTPGHGPRGDCWIWTDSCDPDGYGSLSIRSNGIRANLRAHRVAYYLHHGQPVLLVLHSCNLPACVRPQHLRQGTVLDNMEDKVLSGRAAKGSTHGQHVHPERTARGSRNGSAKLTDDMVRQIRHLHQQGMNGVRIAARFTISRSQVSKILLRHVWRHLE